MNAWASGGFLPPSVRGTTYNGLICGWDWYGTTALLAGVDPHDARAEAAGLPPVDSHDMTAVLLGTNLTSPRTEIPLGTQPMQTIIYPGGTAVQGIIQRDAETGDLWKLLTGDVFMAAWTGPQYPNRSTMTDVCFGNGAQCKCPCESFAAASTAALTCGTRSQLYRLHRALRARLPVQPLRRRGGARRPGGALPAARVGHAEAPG